jgi:hypothetical protein
MLARLRSFAARNRDELMLALVAIVLYAPGMGWGLPTAINADLTRPWGPDDIAPLGPLAEAYNTFVEPQPDRHLAYPLMHYLVVLAAYLPFLLYLVLTGGLTAPGAGFPFGLTDPEGSLRAMALIARTVTCLMAAGSVVAVYHIGRTMWSRAHGLIAGVCVMLLYPMFYYARTGNLDVPYLFWGLAGIAVYARILRQGLSVRRAIWLGVFAALCAGTKDQGGALFLLMPLAILPLHFARGDAAAPRGGLAAWRAPLSGLAAATGAYLFSSGLAFRPERYVAHMRWIGGHAPNSPVLFGYPLSGDGIVAMSARTVGVMAESLTLPLLVAAAAGVLLTLWRDRRAALLLLPAAGTLLLVLLPVRLVQMRYLLPVAATLAIFAAVPLADAFRARGRGARATALALVVVLCALPLMRGLALTYAMRNDARYAAAVWLEERLPDDARIGFFGPSQKLPGLRRGVELVRPVPYRGTDQSVRYTAAQLDRMAADVAASPADVILIIPDHSNVPDHPYGTTLPVALYQRLAAGALGYEAVARFETPALARWLALPPLDYPVVSPTVEIFARAGRLAARPAPAP